MLACLEKEVFVDSLQLMFKAFMGVSFANSLLERCGELPVPILEKFDEFRMGCRRSKQGVMFVHCSRRRF